MNTNEQNLVITLDVGTTNTRAVLTSSGKPILEARRSVGVGNTARDGNNSQLKEAIASALRELVEGRDVLPPVVASGMITSNVGLYELPHIVAPAGLEDLAAGAEEVYIPEVYPEPILFIPGVKNFDYKDVGNMDCFEAMDIMRGEEVEAMAIVAELGRKAYSSVLVLPGSHSKYVFIDDEGRISGCLTSITGELLSVICNNTILADAVGRCLPAPDKYEREMLLCGYETAQSTGLGRACFSGRILSRFAGKTPNEVAYYLLGAVLQSDVEALNGSSVIQCNEPGAIFVSGKNPLRDALADVLRNAGYLETVIVDRAGKAPLSVTGALAVYNEWLKQNERA